MPPLLAWVGAALGKWEQHYPQSVLPILASSRKGTPHAASPSEVNRFHPPLCLLTWALTFPQSSATCGGWAGLQALRRPLRESSLATTPQSSTDLHRFLSLSFISAPFQKKKTNLFSTHLNMTVNHHLYPKDGPYLWIIFTGGFCF